MNRIRFSNEDESYNLVVGQVFGKRPMNDSKHVVAGRLASPLAAVGHSYQLLPNELDVTTW